MDNTTHHAFTDDINSPPPVVIGNPEVITVADMERIPGDPATCWEAGRRQHLSKLDAEMTVEGQYL